MPLALRDRAFRGGLAESLGQSWFRWATPKMPQHEAPALCRARTSRRNHDSDEHLSECRDRAPKRPPHEGQSSQRDAPTLREKAIQRTMELNPGRERSTALTTRAQGVLRAQFGAVSDAMALSARTSAKIGLLEKEKISFIEQADFLK